MDRKPFIKNKEVQFWYMIVKTRDLLDTKIFSHKGEDYIKESLGMTNRKFAYREACKIYTRFLELLSEDLLNGDEFKLPMNKKGSFFVKTEKPNYAKYITNENYTPTANINFEIDIDVYKRIGKHYFIKPRKELKRKAEERVINENFKYLKDV